MINLKILQKKVAKFASPREPAILIHTVKLNEEVGELCNDILATLQLAHYTNVDIERAVNDKIKKIEEKYIK